MKWIGAFLLFLPTCLWANPDIKTVVSPHGVATKISWAEKSVLGPDAFLEKLFAELSKEYYIESMDKIFEETIQTVENPKLESTTTTKKIYFFVKPAASHYPEAMVTFKVTTVNYSEAVLKDPKIKRFPSISIVVDEPFQFYIDYFDFSLNSFDIRSIQLQVTATSNGNNWIISTNFSIKDLFLIKWLTSVKDTLKLPQEPKVHTALLFFKQRFDYLGDRLYHVLNK